MRSTLTLWFPVLALAGGAVAYVWPATLIEWRAAIVPLLSLVMFGMGLTLTPGNFAAVLRRPGVVAIGLALQFTLMPLLGWGLGSALALSSPLLVGMVLVGSCPGGTASNVICYLARGDVALSITLTACSTLLAVVLTPALTWLYLGERVPVPLADMLASLVRIVLLPVLAGVLLNHWLRRWLAPVKRFFPLVSMGAIVVIIAIVVALNSSQLATVASGLVAAVLLHNLLGLLSGYLLARLLGYEQTVARTLAIEVGMQNSGLAVALATKFFSPGAALPGALFSVWHNLSGAALAAWWSRRDRRS